MSEELKPCPFCGASAKAYIAFPKSPEPWCIDINHGQTCPVADSYCYSDEAELTAAWNTRPANESTPA